MARSPRNKTLDLSVQECAAYASRALHLTGKSTLSEVTDRIICGDNIGIMPLLPEKSVDLLIADPPYNLDKNFNSGKFKRLTVEQYMEYTDQWLKLTIPLLKDDASIYICCDWQSSPAIYLVMKKYFHIRNRISWQREKGRGALNNWKNGMEDIWFATVSDNYTFNAGAVKMRRRVIAPYRSDGKPKDWEETSGGNFRNTFASNFWDDISIPYWSMKENTPHPTQKPEKLLAKLILASSDAGDMVFDPFAGSGSTAVTARKLDRRFIGVEKDSSYCAWAQKRLEDAEKDPSIQGYADGVFWERNTAAIQRKKQ